MNLTAHLSSFLVVATAVAVAGLLIFYKPLAKSSTWRATITPLASIMGSGFLVCAPLLYSSVGNYSVFVIGGLLLLAYLVGSVIRFNIQFGERYFEESRSVKLETEREEHRIHVGHHHVAVGFNPAEAMEFVEKASHIVLAGAYCISVSYYLQLLGNFALQSFSIDIHLWAKIIVTFILAVIAMIGLTKGLKGIERSERVVVGFNLAMIAALIVGLLVFNLEAVFKKEWALEASVFSDDKFHLLRVVMGMLIVVQGFETSRFLGSEHSSDERVRTMKYAQWVATAVYVVFIGLMALVMNRSQGVDESGITAIIGVSAMVAAVLPLLLTITAIGSQLSAAMADDAGCSGLLEAILNGKIPKKYDYLLVSGLAITLTWLTDVYEIISWASRAFALFYTLQCVVAVFVALKSKSELSSATWPKVAGFTMLAVICLFVTIMGVPAG